MFGILKSYMIVSMICLFLPERMKIEKVKKFAVNFHNKKEYAIHIKNLKQALNQILVLKKVHTCSIKRTKQKNYLV